MKKIIIIGTKLNEKYECLLDDDDYEICSKYLWSVKKHSKSTYAVANYWYDDGRKTSIMMHRLIIYGDNDVMNHRDEYIDHLNGNGLDNRRSNLKKVTPLQNSQNRQHVGSNNKTGIIGVTYRETKWSENTSPSGEYIAYIYVNRKRMSKNFSCSKYGRDKAKIMAINQRKAWEKEFYHKWTTE